jgi:hypothetical protein
MMVGQAVRRRLKGKWPAISEVVNARGILDKTHFFWAVVENRN